MRLKDYTLPLQSTDSIFLKSVYKDKIECIQSIIKYLTSDTATSRAILAIAATAIGISPATTIHCDSQVKNATSG